MSPLPTRAQLLHRLIAQSESFGVLDLDWTLGGAPSIEQALELLNTTWAPLPLGTAESAMRRLRGHDETKFSFDVLRYNVSGGRLLTLVVMSDNGRVNRVVAVADTAEALVHYIYGLAHAAQQTRETDVVVEEAQ